MEVHHYCPYVVDRSNERTTSRKNVAPAQASSSSEAPGAGYNPDEDQTDTIERVAVTLKPTLDKPPAGPGESEPRDVDGGPADAVVPQPPEDAVDDLPDSVRRDLRKEATSTRHLLTHEPKNPYCSFDLYEIQGTTEASRKIQGQVPCGPKGSR